MAAVQQSSATLGAKHPTMMNRGSIICGPPRWRAHHQRGYDRGRPSLVRQPTGAGDAILSIYLLLYITLPTRADRYLLCFAAVARPPTWILAHTTRLKAARSGQGRRCYCQPVSQSVRCPPLQFLHYDSPLCAVWASLMRAWAFEGTVYLAVVGLSAVSAVPSAEFPVASPPV